jgi:hypothetical protein
MSTASGISDITWDMMSDAGIDTDLVYRRPTGLGTDEYVLIKGSTKVAFGPAVDIEGDGSTNGWEVSAYELVQDSGEDEGYWDHGVQEWAATPAEALRLVAAAVPS